MLFRLMHRGGCDVADQDFTATVDIDAVVVVRAETADHHPVHAQMITDGEAGGPLAGVLMRVVAHIRTAKLPAPRREMQGDLILELDRARKVGAVALESDRGRVVPRR